MLIFYRAGVRKVDALVSLSDCILMDHSQTVLHTFYTQNGTKFLIILNSNLIVWFLLGCLSQVLIGYNKVVYGIRLMQ